MTENEKITINGKEVTLYREVETNLYRFSKDAVDMLLEALEEREQYRAIGTIEEFKALKEKSVAKKAKWHPNPCAEDNRIPICPNCNTIMVRTEIFGRTIDEHCVSCGQAIDWSE